MSSAGQIPLVKFPTFLKRDKTFVAFCLLSCTPIGFRKDVYSKRKEFAPTGSKFFLFRVDIIFKKGSKTILREIYPSPLNVTFNHSVQQNNDDPTFLSAGLVDRSDAHPTGDQQVAGLDAC